MKSVSQLFDLIAILKTQFDVSRDQLLLTCKDVDRMQELPP